MSLDLRSVVDELFEGLAISKGQALISFTKKNNNVDKVTGENTSGTETVETVSGFIDNDSKNILDGTRWRQGSILLGTHYSYEPDIDDVLTFNGQDYSIVAISPVNPSGITHYYTVQAQA